MKPKSEIELAREAALVKNTKDANLKDKKLKDHRKLVYQRTHNQTNLFKK